MKPHLPPYDKSLKESLVRVFVVDMYSKQPPAVLMQLIGSCSLPTKRNNLYKCCSFVSRLDKVDRLGICPSTRSSLEKQKGQPGLTLIYFWESREVCFESKWIEKTHQGCQVQVSRTDCLASLRHQQVTVLIWSEILVKQPTPRTHDCSAWSRHAAVNVHQVVVLTKETTDHNLRNQHCFLLFGPQIEGMVSDKVGMVSSAIKTQVHSWELSQWGSLHTEVGVVSSWLPVVLSLMFQHGKWQGLVITRMVI